MDSSETFDVVVVGGGPAGATAAYDLARSGRSVLLLDRSGRIKPCGGAIPPRLIREFEIPESLLVARVTAARMVAPSHRRVDIPIEGGYVGMVDRDVFDEWLRNRAAGAGAIRHTGVFDRITHDPDGVARIHYWSRDCSTDSTQCSVRSCVIIGADGAASSVARQTIACAKHMQYVFAYHEIVRSPDLATPSAPDFDGTRCDVVYRGTISPDFYGWVFPHGATTSVGTGSALKGFSLRGAVATLRANAGLSESETLRKDGAPIPSRPLARWDNGRDVVLAGDAAGVVAPASGEGIYYAMAGGRYAAQAVIDMFTRGGDARCLAQARRNFMKAHRRVFWVLGIMQRFWYTSDRRRERFVSICRDRDVQQLTFDAYMNKELVRAKPIAHVRIFFKDLAHLLGIATQ